MALFLPVFKAVSGDLDHPNLVCRYLRQRFGQWVDLESKGPGSIYSDRVHLSSL